MQINTSRKLVHTQVKVIMHFLIDKDLRFVLQGNNMFMGPTNVVQVKQLSCNRHQCGTLIRSPESIHHQQGNMWDSLFCALEP